VKTARWWKFPAEEWLIGLSQLERKRDSVGKVRMKGKETG